ncbi:unnamed protein product [Trifolium pratense]|uniref:Uncharacterized protein n=1 Tax=Trifolium pratense TaxID=57577 RepID=A0ACB0KRL5_TRIPR|nr:unnamed protein product [Trifolium pratense]
MAAFIAPSNLQISPHFLASPQFSRTFPPPSSRKPFRPRSALKEWRDYEEAVKRKDLAGALSFLKSLETEQRVTVEPFGEGTTSPVAELTRSRFRELELFGPQRDWEVLDTCMNADNMKLVANAYKFLKDRGFLPNFGKCRNIVLEGTRNVTPDVLSSSTGLEVTKLAPKKWGLSDGSSTALVAFLGGVSFLISQGIDLRPNLAVILGLAFADSIFLGGTCLAQISSYWPPYRRRILIHEAGHLLIGIFICFLRTSEVTSYLIPLHYMLSHVTPYMNHPNEISAYLMGCPIRGVILDPIVAMQMGIQGQAGTQFWDEKVASDLAEGRLDGSAFDRYCMVLFAGIAAEALIYGEAEGGENDENLFRNVCLLLEPPLSVAEMSNQARWSVMQSYNLLKWHKAAHRAAVKALETGGSLSAVIRRIEETLYSEK